MVVFEEAGSCGGVAVQRVLVWLAAGVALGVVTGASAAPAAVEPVATGAGAGAGGAEMDSGARPLSDVVWGFLLVLLAQALSFWGSFKHRNDSLISSLTLLLGGVFSPLHGLGLVILASCGCVSMVWKCHKSEDPEMRMMSFKWIRILLSLSNPWSKLPARILTGCDIVLYLPNGASLNSIEMSRLGQLEGIEEANEGMERDLESALQSNEVSRRRSELLAESWEWLWERMEVEDESEAMVVGADGDRKCKNEYYDKKQLGVDGKLALLWGTFFQKDDIYNFLPGYGELKFLRGNSGFATIAIAIQAIGYIYATLFRSVKDLPVAPVEVIGLILNMILLVKASHYFTSTPCHRPLVIYMNEEQEKKFLGLLNSKPRSSFDIYENTRSLIFFSTLLVIVLCVFIPSAHFIDMVMGDINIMIVLPLILFLIGIFGGFLELCCTMYGSPTYIVMALRLLSILLNAIAYSWAMVVTLQHWKHLYFCSRPKLLDLSQIIPFIG